MSPERYYLTFYSTYHTTYIALCSVGATVDSIAIENKQSSKLLLIVLDQLLQLHKLRLEDMRFLAAYQGPAPFTSLRTVIATVNGLAFGSHLPLVGVNGLETFIKEYSSQYTHALLVLLNAYCDDVYYALSIPGQSLESGVLSINRCIELIHKKLPTGKFTIIGNGYELHKNVLQISFKDRLNIPQEVPEMPSLDAVVREAYQAFGRDEVKDMLIPLYLKSFSSIVGSS